MHYYLEPARGGVGLTIVESLSFAQLTHFGLEAQAAVTLEPCGRPPRYGIGPLTSITILAEFGDARRFSSSREAVRYAGMDITVHQSDARRAPGRLSRQGPPALRWALYEAAQCARRPNSPDHDYYLETAARLGATAPVWRSAQATQAQLPHPARARRGGPAARMTAALRAPPFITPMHRGQLPACACRHLLVDGLHRQNGRTASPKRITPSTIMSPTTQIRSKL